MLELASWPCVGAKVKDGSQIVIWMACKMDCKIVVDRPLNEWMTDNILVLKAICRKNELIWRQTCITINFNIYYDSCMAVKKAISKRKAELMEKRVINCEGDQKKLFSLIHSLFGSKKITVMPEYTSSFTLVSSINMFFIEKIHKIKMEFPLLEACLPGYSFVDIDTIMPVCTAVFDTFQPLSCDVLASIIHKLNRTTCGLDPFPTKLLMFHYSSIINIILRIVNPCFSPGDFPASCKSAIIYPLIKYRSNWNDKNNHIIIITPIERSL